MSAPPTTAPGARRAAVAPAQRHTRHHPCLICSGGVGDPHGRGVRCYGFTSDDGRYVFCTREEYAGSLSRRDDGLYKHFLGGLCRCGVDHSTSAPVSAPLLGEVCTPSATTRAPTRAPTRAHLASSPDATYSYRALDSGAPLRKLRYGAGKGKRFVWQRAEAQEGLGDWLDCRGDRPTPDAYRAEELAEADPWAPVFITEGEKDCDLIRAAGGVAISPPDGVGSWRDVYSSHVTGRQVVICADDDADGKGLRHAERVAANVAPFAVSVRILLFTPTHDVGDWLMTGHTFAELSALAASTPITTARQPQVLNGSFTTQDAPSVCRRCERAEERARIAETSLANLRRERAREDAYLAIPNEKMSAPVKLAALAMRRELDARRCDDRIERDEERRPRIYRAAIAQRIGVKEGAAGAAIQKAAKIGLFDRNEKRSIADTATYFAPGPFFDTPDAIATPERANSWGGHRRACPICRSENLTTYTVCRDCGTVFDKVDLSGDGPQVLNGSFTTQDAPSVESAENGAPHADLTSQDDSPLSLFYVRRLDVVSAAKTPRAPLATQDGTPIAEVSDPVWPDTAAAISLESETIRADVQAFAQRLGYPRVPIGPGASVSSGASAWAAFAASGDALQIAAAFSGLTAYQGGIPDGS